MSKKIAVIIGLVASTSLSCSSTQEAQRPSPGALGATNTPNDNDKVQQPSTQTDPTDTGKATELVRGDLRDLIFTLRRVHFAFNSDALTPGTQEALAEAGEILARHTDTELHVEGHADERGTTEYNLGLGERRASAVVNYLTAVGVLPSQLNVVSFGEERPLAPGSTPSAWSKNRRVDFALIHGELQLVIEDGDLLDDRGNPLASMETTSLDGEKPTLTVR